MDWTFDSYEMVRTEKSSASIVAMSDDAVFAFEEAPELAEGLVADKVLVFAAAAFGGVAAASELCKVLAAAGSSSLREVEAHTS